MKSRLFLIGAALAFSGTATAKISSEHSKSFSLVADAVTSGQTCSQMGYSVDFDGILAFREDRRTSAIASGHDPAEVNAALEERIALRYKNLERLYRGNKRMGHSEVHVARHEQRWEKRCKKLAENDATSHLFVKID